MSQAVIDFCDGLKTTLLGVEERLARARASLEAGASLAQSEAKKHVDEAAEQLAAFKLAAARLAATLRAEAPDTPAEAQAMLKEFGQEAQVALRHAVVFMAESTAKGAETAAAALKKGAEHLRRETAVTAAPPSEGPGASAPA